MRLAVPVDVVALRAAWGQRRRGTVSPAAPCGKLARADLRVRLRSRRGRIGGRLRASGPRAAQPVSRALGDRRVL